MKTQSNLFRVMNLNERTGTKEVMQLKMELKYLKDRLQRFFKSVVSKTLTVRAPRDCLKQDLI